MKFRSYKKKKINFSFIIILILISIGIAILIIHNYSKKVDEVIKPIAKEKVRKFISMRINAATIGVDFNRDIIEIEKENNIIKMVNYNTNEVIKLLDKITFNIQDELANSLDGSYYIVDYVNMGIIFNSTMLRNIGPKIPIKMKIMGDIISNIETEVKAYGINNAYIEVRVYLEVTGLVVLPFTIEEVKISNVIPIFISIISGEVPSGYIASYK